MQDIKVSIHCITYNHEKYIKDAIESFIMQKTNFQYEVIIHDDASTDRTPEIIKEYEKVYPDIIKPIYQSENQYKRCNLTYTYMLPITRGKYIAICEGDDYWIDENKLQKQFDYMEEHSDCSLVAHKTWLLNANSNKYKDYNHYDFSEKEICNPLPEIVIKDHLIFHTSSLFFRKEFYDHNREFITSFSAYDYVIKILLATEGKVHVFPEEMSVYRKATEESWTVRVAMNPKIHIKQLERSVNILNGINAYRNYKYDDVIQKNIQECKFNILLLKRDIKGLKSNYYKDYFNRLSKVEKSKVIIKIMFPFVVKIKQKLLLKRKK